MAKAMKKVQVTKDDVDQLGDLLAQIADLQKQANAIKAQIKEAGSTVNGDYFQAVVIYSKRTSLDSKKVATMLGDKLSLVQKTSSVVTVKVTAKKA